MKVLHVGNTGFGAVTLKSHFESIDNHIHDIIILSYDNLEIGKAINIGHAGLDVKKFATLEELKFGVYQLVNYFDYDIVHVHALYHTIPNIKRANSKIPIIYNGRGTDIRNGFDKNILQCDKIVVSTKDLVGKVNGEEIYLPNTPDIKHFVRKNHSVDNLALVKTFAGSQLDNQKALAEAFDKSLELGFRLIIQNRSKTFFPYLVYPRYLELFKIFFDYKIMINDEFNPLPLSFTALQMLVMGGMVFHNSGTFCKLPEEYNYDKVMGQWSEIYRELLN